MNSSSVYGLLSFSSCHRLRVPPLACWRLVVFSSGMPWWLMVSGNIHENALSPPPWLSVNWPFGSSPRTPMAALSAVEVVGRALRMIRLTVTGAPPPCSAEAPRRISTRSSSPEGRRPTVVSA